MTPILKTLIKIFLSCLILGILFHEVQWDSLKLYFQSLKWNYFLLALLVQLLSSIVAAGRWSLLMKSLGFTAPLSFYIKSYFKGVMFNQVLPSSIGGDAYRMIEVNQLHKGKKKSILSVLVDRIYGLIGLTLLALISLPWVFHILSFPIFKLISVVSCLLLLSIILLLLLNFPFFLFLKKIPGCSFILDLAKELLKSTHSAYDFIFKIILSLLIQLLTVYAFYLLTKGLPITVSFTNYVVIIPTILLFTMLPLSFAGWGIREGAMVYFGTLIGLLKPEALAVSILFGLLLILSSLPGLFLYLFTKHPPLHKLN